MTLEAAEGTAQIVPVSSFSAIQGGSVLGLSVASPVVLVLFVLVVLCIFMSAPRLELSVDTGVGCSSFALFCRARVGISTALAAVGAALSVMEEKDQRIPACIADIVGDIVGDIVWKLLSGLC